jgi:hypothetical protein
MKDRRNAVMPIAAALGALAGTSPATAVNASPSPNSTEAQPSVPVQAGQPNTLVSTGKDLLGFTINEQADGTIVAQHRTHRMRPTHPTPRTIQAAD